MSNQDFERACNDQLWADTQDWIGEADPALVFAVADLLEAESADDLRTADIAELEVIQNLARTALREAAMRRADRAC